MGLELMGLAFAGFRALPDPQRRHAFLKLSTRITLAQPASFSACSTEAGNKNGIVGVLWAGDFEHASAGGHWGRADRGDCRDHGIHLSRLLRYIRNHSAYRSCPRGAGLCD